MRRLALIALCTATLFTACNKNDFPKKSPLFYAKCYGDTLCMAFNKRMIYANDVYWYHDSNTIYIVQDKAEVEERLLHELTLNIAVKSKLEWGEFYVHPDTGNAHLYFAEYRGGHGDAMVATSGNVWINEIDSNGYLTATFYTEDEYGNEARGGIYHARKR